MTRKDNGWTYEEWYLDGHRHRNGGLPARVITKPRKVKDADFYYVHGEVSRLDGPAQIEYPNPKKAGDYAIELFRLRGRQYESLEKLHEGLLHLHESDFSAAETEVRCSLYGSLLEEGHDSLTVAQALVSGVRTVDGVRQVANGAPVEWVRAFEESRS